MNAAGYKFCKGCGAPQPLQNLYPATFTLPHSAHLRSSFLAAAAGAGSSFFLGSSFFFGSSLGSSFFAGAAAPGGGAPQPLQNL